jgi:molybdopterin biosynthesis enzyme MoaB
LRRGKRKRTSAVEMAVQAAAVISNGGTGSAGRDKGIGGGGKEGVLT